MPSTLSSDSRLTFLLFGLAVLVGLGLRVLLAWAYYGNYDQQSYEIVQGIMRTGGNVYAETSRYNYSRSGRSSWPAWTGLGRSCRGQTMPPSASS